MKELNTIENLNWLPAPNTMKTFLSHELPEEAGITSSFVLVFEEGKLLLAKVEKRTWDIPGGHKEAGETSIETAYREMLEETNISVKNIQPIGYDELFVQGDRPEGYNYPFPKSYLAYFIAEIDQKNEFHAEFETSDIAFFPLEEALHFPWVKNHVQLVEYAQKLSNAPKPE